MSETLEWKYPEELMDDNGYPTTEAKTKNRMVLNGIVNK